MACKLFPDAEHCKIYTVLHCVYVSTNALNYGALLLLIYHDMVHI